MGSMEYKGVQEIRNNPSHPYRSQQPTKAPTQINLAETQLPALFLPSTVYNKTLHIHLPQSTAYTWEKVPLPSAHVVSQW